MNKTYKLDMLSGSLGDKILLFALPLAVTGILQQLFNAADIAVVGRFVGKNAMAAVGSNSPVIGLTVNLFLGVSLGANVVIARFTGEHNGRNIQSAVHTAILVSLISGSAIAVLGQFFAAPLLRLLSVPDAVFPMALLYLRFYLAGMPVILLYNFESAIFRSQGDTRTPLICLLASGIINVLLNLFFVCILNMTVEGVALATVISNAVSSAMLFVFLLKSKTAVKIDRRKFHIHGAILIMMLKIGLPAGLQGMVFSLSNLCVQSAINSLGADAMAGSAAAFNVEILAYFIINAFGQACTTFIGQNYGARQLERCKKILGLCLLQDAVFTAVLSVLILLADRLLLSIFNTDAAVIDYGIIRLRFIVSAELINVVIEVMSGCLRGFGRSLVPALLALVGICGTRITWIYTVFPRRPEFGTLMAVYPISWAVTASAIVIAYLLTRRTLFGGRPSERNNHSQG